MVNSSSISIFFTNTWYLIDVRVADKYVKLPATFRITYLVADDVQEFESEGWTCCW